LTYIVQMQGIHVLADRDNPIVADSEQHVVVIMVASAVSPHAIPLEFHRYFIVLGNEPLNLHANAVRDGLPHPAQEPIGVSAVLKTGDFQPHWIASDPPRGVDVKQRKRLMRVIR
jgi:hypothetical protein